MTEELNRYAVVSYGYYYPSGFENDVRGRFKTIDEAKLFILDQKILNEYSSDCVYVFDLVDWKKVWDKDEE